MVVAAGCARDCAPQADDLCARVRALCGQEQRCRSPSEWKTLRRELGDRAVDGYRACLRNSKGCADVGDCDSDPVIKRWTSQRHD
jgi:hypothetical protein